MKGDFRRGYLGRKLYGGAWNKENVMGILEGEFLYNQKILQQWAIAKPFNEPKKERGVRI